MLEVTIWDADGNIVTHEFCEAQTATQTEIDDMVRMIEVGTPAWLAAQIVNPSGAGEG